VTHFDEQPEYVWHFKLTTDAVENPDPDALTAMVRDQLAALLRCVILTRDGSDLKVTGFRFLDDLDREHTILPGPTVPPPAGADPGSSSEEGDAEAGADGGSA
jgi:hypothetical protein